MIQVRVGHTYPDARKAYATSLEEVETIINKTMDLFMRLDTQRAELVATVLFAARCLQRQESRRPSEREVLTEVVQWKQKRRPPLDESEVALAIRNLAALGWLDVVPSQDLPLPPETLAIP